MRWQFNALFLFNTSIRFKYLCLYTGFHLSCWLNMLVNEGACKAELALYKCHVMAISKSSIKSTTRNEHSIHLYHLLFNWTIFIDQLVEAIKPKRELHISTVLFKPIIEVTCSVGTLIRICYSWHVIYRPSFDNQFSMKVLKRRECIVYMSYVLPL